MACLASSNALSYRNNIICVAARLPKYAAHVGHNSIKKSHQIVWRAGEALFGKLGGGDI